MANINKIKGRIGILTGGGDVPGLNPAIRGVTMRAIKEGYEVIGLRRGWAGLAELVRDDQYDNSNNYIKLTPDIVTKAARTGGTFLHSSRTKASKVPRDLVPDHLKDKYTDDLNDLTPDIVKNLDYLGIDTLIPIGGDDTLSYGVHLHDAGFKCIAIPKTMDNDVPGTDYCIGFSTCVTRTIELSNNLRTSTGSHERILVMEAFGRYAGFSALMPAMAGAADRCMIPEYKPTKEELVQLLVADRKANPSNYSIVIVSEGAMFSDHDDMIFNSHETDMFGHKKLGGISDEVSDAIKELSPKFNNGKKVETIVQRLGYMVRSGNPDAIDSTIPMAWGNLALDLIIRGESGKLVCVKNGKYGVDDLEVVTSYEKVVDVDQYYNTARLRPKYKSFEGNSVFNVGTKR
ncbi:MAG: ATP-dependent 6-phosphofructokinase [Ignavibacteriae bacterium]|jgi:6-phosphofructokinase 1|nr:ATP-dependent 6-phosphofructokinase [Ignavibacteriota bacterium]NOG98671.1 ATP-dependent 6-phosphofructokinase [Ignavibacteriota bacterium]